MKFDKLKKEDLELMSYKDITNLILEEKKELNTAELFTIIKDKLDMTQKEFESKIADYYTTLTTDKRFILLENGKWDLRKRHKSDKIININDDEDEESEEELLKSKDDEDSFDDVDNYDNENNDDDFEDDDDDSLKDLVIIDEDELELEQ